MKQLYLRLQKLLPGLGILLSMIWLSNLADTDAYFSVYVLLAFGSFFLQIRDAGAERQGRGLSLGAAAVFSAAVLLANYPLFTAIGDPALIGRSTSILMNLINACLSFLGGCCVAYPILQAFLGRFPLKCRDASPFARKRWLPWAVFGVLVLIHGTHLFLVEYPGNVTEDSFSQIEEMISGNYSEFNTFWHTMLFRAILSLGYGLFQDVNAAVACFSVFQIVILAFSFTYGLVALGERGVPKWFLTAAGVLYALLPYHMALSITAWKDVLYGAGCLLLAASWLRSMGGYGGRRNRAVFLLASVLCFVSRSVGWSIYAVTFLVTVLLDRRNKKLLAMLGAMTLLGWAMMNPLLTVLKVEEGDLAESLSVPIQQVSRVVTEGCPLTQEEEALLSQVVDLEEVPQLYQTWISDPMKVELRSKDYDYFLENFRQYQALWLRLGLRYPAQYLKAWVDQTKGYWNAGYPYALYSETVTENPYGVEKSASGNPVASLFRLYFGLSRHLIFFQPLHSIGLHVWLLVMCLLLNIRRRRREGLLLVPFAVMVLGLWFGTPVYCSFRYVYPLFAAFPLLLGATMFDRQEADCIKR